MNRLLLALLYLIFSLYLIASCSSFSNNAEFCNEEVCIEFNETIQIKKSGFKKPTQPYFSDAISLVKFNRYNMQDKNIQQPEPEKDNYISKMYILPYKSLKYVEGVFNKLLSVKESHERYIPFNLRSDKQPKIGWQYQVGKSKFDYYLVIGKKYNYLFVSPSSASNKTIEVITNRMKFL